MPRYTLRPHLYIYIIHTSIKRCVDGFSNEEIKYRNTNEEMTQLQLTPIFRPHKSAFLIPKKDAEPYLIKNWRPISLLNCDYKIAAKAIANRFKHVFPNLIDNDQTGFLKGRFIGENIRLVDGVIKYAAAKNIPGLLLFLDFEKAFDTGRQFTEHLFYAQNLNLQK